ncbi:MAG: conjugal transfer protein TraX [Ruminococcaceae bacterium]|nr:conjugal transfer protein TraX [Oscillospiraceae bacterium]
MHTTEQTRRGLSSFTLHCIAMVLMLGDHLWATFLPQQDWLTCVGRLAFPIFAFLLAEGFWRTANLNKYMRRMLLFALASEIPFNLMVSRRIIQPFHQNVLWTFLLSLIALSAVKKLETKGWVLRIAGTALTALGFYVLGFVTFVDYYGYGILMVMLFYLTRSGQDAPRSVRMGLMAVQLLGMYWINVEMMGGLVYPVTLLGWSFEFPRQGLALLALPILWLYDGRQGLHNPYTKWGCYLFYPVHLLILGGLLKLL